MSVNHHTIDRRVGIGHVHLKVSDLKRALDFYCGVLGFELTQRWGAGRRFFLPEAITITSVSTLGKVSVVRHRPKARPAYFISPSFILIALNSAMLCVG